MPRKEGGVSSARRAVLGEHRKDHILGELPPLRARPPLPCRAASGRTLGGNGLDRSPAAPPNGARQTSCPSLGVAAQLRESVCFVLEIRPAYSFVKIIPALRANHPLPSLNAALRQWLRVAGEAARGLPLRVDQQSSLLRKRSVCFHKESQKLVAFFLKTFTWLSIFFQV